MSVKQGFEILVVSILCVILYIFMSADKNLSEDARIFTKFAEGIYDIK